MLVQAGTQLGVMALLARYLAPEDFGLVAAANIVITLVQMISEGGIGTAVVQRPNVSGNVVGVAVTVSLIISAVCFLGLAAVALPFEVFLGMKHLAVVVLVLGAGAFFSGVSSLLEGLLQREMNFAALFRVNIYSSVFGYAVPAVALAAAGAGVWSIVVATLGRIAVKLVLVACMYSSSLRPCWEPAVARDLLHFGFGLTQDRFWNWASAQTAPFAIGLLFGQAQLGQFYMGSQLAVLPAQYLSSIVSAVYFPILSRTLGDPRLVTRQFLTIMTVGFVVTTAMGVLLAMNAPLIVEIAFGSGWDHAVVVFEILCLGAGIRSCIQICDAVNIARGDVYALANRRAAAAVTMFVGMYAANNFGLAGAAWAIMASHSLMLFLTIGLAVVGVGISMETATPFVRRLGLALGLILMVDIPVLYLREANLVGGIPLLVLTIIVNMVITLPLILVLSELMRGILLARFSKRLRSKGA